MSSATTPLARSAHMCSDMAVHELEPRTRRSAGTALLKPSSSPIAVEHVLSCKRHEIRWLRRSSPRRHRGQPTKQRRLQKESREDFLREPRSQRRVGPTLLPNVLGSTSVVKYPLLLPLHPRRAISANTYQRPLGSRVPWVSRLTMAHPCRNPVETNIEIHPESWLDAQATQIRTRWHQISKQMRPAWRSTPRRATR